MPAWLIQLSGHKFEMLLSLCNFVRRSQAETDSAANWPRFAAVLDCGTRPGYTSFNAHSAGQSQIIQYLEQTDFQGMGQACFHVDRKIDAALQIDS